MAATPELLPLSPLETSLKKDPNPAAGQSNLSVPKDRDAARFLQSPTPSFAESFSTAFTSPDDEVDEATRLGLSSLAPPQSLRKSVSVDSFTPYNRDGSRTQLNSSPEPSHSNVYSAVPVAQRRSDAQVWPGRHNESLNALRRDHESSSPPDSDIDRYDPISLPAIERFRHASLKSQDPSKPPLRAGDLSLPSRTQSGSAVASSSGHGPREREHLPSLSSASLQASFRRGSAFAPPTVGRVRSGSLGYNPPNSSKRTIFNPHIPPSIRSSSPKQDITLVVFGTMGCGKSTVIKNALSGWALAESTVVSESTHSSFSRYIRRTGSLMIDQFDQSPSPGGSVTVLDVFEVEIQTTSSGLVEWPQGLPAIDGVVICYDSSTTSSFQPIESLLKGYRSMILPIMVLSCKADIPHEVEPNDAVEMLKRYDTGLIEVTNTTDLGKERMDQSFQYLLKAIFRQRGPDRVIDNRNPATPDILFKKTTWSGSPNNTPTTSSTIPSPTGVSSLNVNSHVPQTSDTIDSAPTLDSVAPPSLPWMNSMGDSLQENQTPGSQGEDVAPTDSEDTHHHNDLENSPGLPDEGPSYLSEAKKNGAKKEPRPAQWADLDDLLDKLLFLAVSGDDPTFTIHFLLTYRRFATPRSVLLAMQKRMRQLDNPCGDPMFACFAQMRICHLLETWIRDYPHDFAVKGTAGALNALIKSIISKTHLLHYGSEFLPFLEQLPGLVDQDSAWALKVVISDNDSDDYDEDDEETHAAKEEVGSGNAISADSHNVAFPLRERKSSLPLPIALLSPAPLNGINPHAYDQSPKQHIKDLVKLAQSVLNTDSDEIAQEITRQGVKRFLEIKPRDWLHYTFVSFGTGRKIDSEPITAFNAVSNLLADWVISLILCHERPRHRARQIEKFVEIAQRLRQMNNYSALRAFVAGINNATDDPTMEQFKARSPDHAKNLMSWDLLLQQIRSHRSYRLALRNSKGACIPALEVHMSDLIRAHEGNGDTNDAYPSKIHWAKFNMMGRFIASTIQCQAQCRNSNDYDFPERMAIAELFVKFPVMSTEMQKSRLRSEDFDFDDVHPSVPPPSQPRDIAGLRRLFFW